MSSAEQVINRLQSLPDLIEIHHVHTNPGFGFEILFSGKAQVPGSYEVGVPPLSLIQALGGFDGDVVLLPADNHDTAQFVLVLTPPDDVLALAFPEDPNTSSPS